jgi:hypothetical protein
MVGEDFHAIVLTQFDSQEVGIKQMRIVEIKIFCSLTSIIQRFANSARILARLSLSV